MSRDRAVSRKPRDREVLHIGTRAWWSVEWRTPASPLWGIGGLLVICACALILTWEAPVEAEVELLARSWAEEVTMVEAVYRTGLVGQSTIHVVGTNARGLTVTERLALEENTGELAERWPIVMGDARLTRKVWRLAPMLIGGLIVAAMFLRRRRQRT